MTAPILSVLTFLFTLPLGACSGGKGDSAGTDSAGGTDSTGGTDDTDTTGADSGATDTDTDVSTCDAVTPGADWAWYGQCPQMRTPVVISVDGCSLTLDYESVGGMTMGMPYSAMVAGSVVTFANDDVVTGCVATLESADRMTGTCDGGCTFELER